MKSTAPKSERKQKSVRTSEETVAPESRPQIRAVEAGGAVAQGDAELRAWVFNRNHHYRFEGATPGDVLFAMFDALHGEGPIYGGLQTAADELEVLEGYILGGGADNDPAIFQNTIHGIQTRLRALAELSRRVLDDGKGLAAPASSKVSR